MSVSAYCNRYFVYKQTKMKLTMKTNDNVAVTLRKINTNAGNLYFSVVGIMALHVICRITKEPIHTMIEH